MHLARSFTPLPFDAESVTGLVLREGAQLFGTDQLTVRRHRHRRRRSSTAGSEPMADDNEGQRGPRPVSPPRS
ncbi:hypothetical protein [Nocardia sp. NPDC019395]|uniref:hypothetical protein n=1 Tax=Nocardia sp. NPDC019395 TaxID=3154686 RepID=UPI0033DB136C